jgi:hypothetical protein
LVARRLFKNQQNKEFENLQLFNYVELFDCCGVGDLVGLDEGGLDGELLGSNVGLIDGLTVGELVGRAIAYIYEQSTLLRLQLLV